MNAVRVSPTCGSTAGRDRWLRWLLAIAFALAAPVHAAEPDQANVKSLLAQASVLRDSLATLEASAPAREQDDLQLYAKRRFLMRQLLASLERRVDLMRSRRDMPDVPATPVLRPSPTSLADADAMRRELQQAEVALALDDRRIALLREDRAAAAERLTTYAAALRQAHDAGADTGPFELEAARLEARVAESQVAEIDLLLGFVDVQRVVLRGEVASLRASVAATGRIPATPQELAQIEQRLDTQVKARQQRLARVASERDALRATLATLPDDASPLAREAAQVRLENRDIEMEMARETLANLETERAAWQIAARYERDGDSALLAQARSRAEPIRQSIMRRAEVMRATGDQILGKLGTLDTRLAAAGEGEAAAVREVRAAWSERLRLVEGTLIEELRTAALIERMTSDFAEQAGQKAFGDRARAAWAEVKLALASVRDFELLTVDASVTVDGRATTVARSVTVGQLLKLPLLLLAGLWLAHKLTHAVERWAVRRRGADEGHARLVARWSFGLLAVAAIVSSLVLAGIPLAALAFVGGAVAIGVGFGMQNLVKNLISGILLLIERPFRLGDEIDVGGLKGTVVDIDLRASVVRDSDGSETLIPNAVLMEQNVRNVTFRSRRSRQQLEFTVDLDAEPRAVMEALEGAAKRHGLLLESPAPQVFHDGFDPTGARFVLHYWIVLERGVDRRRIASDLRLMALAAFADAGIALARAAPAVVVQGQVAKRSPVSA
jgi:small-conductance mechanosensitive channel